MTDVTRITYLGHGTLLLESGGRRVLTDPLLRRWAGPLRRYAPLPGPVGRLDAILLSHLHIDHVDIASLRLLDPATPVLVPPPGAATLRRLHMREVREVVPGDRVELEGLTVKVTPARHAVKRYPMMSKSDGLGYLLDGASTIYYAGDTGPFLEMADVVPKPDVALLPVSGWGPTLDADEHLTPLAAARCLGLLRPSVAIPVHWGTYFPPGLPMGQRRDPRRPARAFARYARRLAPEVEVSVLDPGESIELGV
jgi:L-ascorbate metabolism protein UlaG (beta-lactamase superfamily)